MSTKASSECDATQRLPQWPPEFGSEADLNLAVHSASDWAMGHGLVMRPPVEDGKVPEDRVVHAPFSLFPTPFPEHLFRKAVSIQPAYNELYARVASDVGFLDRVIGGNVVQVDAFQAGLYRIWKRARAQGVRQGLSLGLFRSDYLLHNVTGRPLTIHQVEFNTIASSFGPLSSKVSALHRQLATSGSYPEHPLINIDALPPNGALEGLTDGLAAAHRAYGDKDTIVLMIVQSPERNAFDQKLLEWDLSVRHSIRSVRMTHAEVHRSATLDADGTLRVPLTSTARAEVSVIYFRSGYSPSDYPTETEWEARYQLEISRAIKCPTVALQLAGAKKVQQVLAIDRELQRVANIRSSPTLTSVDVSNLKDTFAGLYAVDSTEDGKRSIEMARSHPERFVLKPQREGGGNNIYKADIPGFLDGLAPGEEEGYILMDVIEPPTEALGNVVVTTGTAHGQLSKDIVSELGIYGVALFNNDEVLLNATAGHLLRTKGREVNEGGVATGFSVLDSPVLV